MEIKGVKKIVIMTAGMHEGKSILQHAIQKQLLNQGVELEFASREIGHHVDFEAHVCSLDKSDPYINDCLVLRNPPKDFEFVVPEGINHLQITTSSFPKKHYQEVQSRISRQSETIRKQLVEVPKVHKNTNRTPKKKKRK